VGFWHIEELKATPMIDRAQHRIQFKKPDLQELTGGNTVVDMHFHTRHSDGHNTVDDIIQHAAGLGIGVAITDHNAVRGAVAFAERSDNLCIPGIEVTSREGSHVLVYFYAVKDLERFYARHILPAMGPDVMSSTSLEMEAVIEAARRFPSVVIFPHPYSAAYTGVQNSYFPEDRLLALYEMVDGIEVINAENMNKWNLQSTVLGFNVGKAITGGSDGHRLPQMGKAVTYAACPPDREAFLDAVKHGRANVIGKEIDLLRKVTSNTFKLKNNIRNYPDLLEKNIRYSYTLLHSKQRSLRESMRRSFYARGR
jgi:predicted metal-dependent phosphoesterase TrpH